MGTYSCAGPNFRQGLLGVPAAAREGGKRHDVPANHRFGRCPTNPACYSMQVS